MEAREEQRGGTLERNHISAVSEGRPFLRNHTWATIREVMLGRGLINVANVGKLALSGSFSLHIWKFI